MASCRLLEVHMAELDWGKLSAGISVKSTNGTADTHPQLLPFGGDSSLAGSVASWFL
jgi:hypothetical protein